MSQTDLAIKHIDFDIEEQCELTILQTVSSNVAAHYHLTSGGSRTRAKLCINAGNALQLPTHTTILIAAAIELLHNASLVHDDVQDGDECRRGVKSVWVKYGKADAICAGDLMISAAYSLVAQTAQLNHLPGAFKMIHEAVAHTICGQHLDLNALTSITDQEYEKIAALKSGPLIQLTLSLPLFLAGYTQFVERAETALAQFAVAYQILDDLEDWQQDLQRSQLNMVNLIALRGSHQQAKFIACNRAYYLLKQCQKTLSLMPQHCGISIIENAAKMITKTESILALLPKGEAIV